MRNGREMGMNWCKWIFSSAKEIRQFHASQTGRATVF